MRGLFQDRDDTENISGWYVVDSRLDLDDERLNVVGTANIILVDGARLYNEDGIRVSPGATLNIYGQAGDSGELYLDADTNDNAALGGDEGEGCGTINIHGGHITADTNNLGEDAAGIGGGEDGSGGTITIYGGTVTGIGGSDSYNGGAGIGGGGAGSGGTITIYGGNVNARGGANAAGIGGGDEGSSGNIAIYGGTVDAQGGSATAENGAGIGGGEKGDGGIITINGGEVTATGGDCGAGIGGGKHGNGVKTTISGGKVIANGKWGAAGIGGGKAYYSLYTKGGNSGVIIITGGEVIADDGYRPDVFTGAGIGNGSLGDDATVTLSYSGANSTRIQTPSFTRYTNDTITVTMDKPFKDLNSGTVYEARTYTAAELSKMQKLNLVPADNPSIPAKKSSRITLQPKTAVYTGKTINIGKARVVGSKGKVTYAYYSDAKCTKKVSEHKNAGVYYVKARVADDASYKAATSKAVKLTIKKASNPITVSPKAQTFKKSALKKADSFAINVENAKGKVTYKPYSKARKAGIRVTKAGLVTIPKHCRRGIYKIQILAAGTRNYKAKRCYVTVRVE